MDYRQYGKFDFTDANDAAIKAGAAWNCTITYTDASDEPKDLTGYTGYMQFRTTPNGPVLAEVSVTIVPLTGEIILALSSQQTLGMRGLGGVYDLYIVGADNAPICLLQGNVEIIPNVTVIP